MQLMLSIPDSDSMAADQKPLVGPRSTRQQPPDVKKDWISSWMGCGISLDILCVGCWCPCMLYAHNVAQLRGEPRFSISTCLTYLSIPLAAAAAVGLASTAAPGALAAIQLAGLALQRVVLASYASPTRGELRQAEGIPGSAAADWALWCLLPQCMLCQEAAQLADWQQRGAAPRSSSCSSKGGALRAPLQQLVECHRQAHRERDAPRSPGGYAALHAGALPREQFVTAVSA